MLDYYFLLRAVLLAAYVIICAFFYLSLTYFTRDKYWRILAGIGLILSLLFAMSAVTLIANTAEFLVKSYHFPHIENFIKYHKTIAMAWYIFLLDKTNFFSLIYYFLSSFFMFYLVFIFSDVAKKEKKIFHFVKQTLVASYCISSVGLYAIFMVLAGLRKYFKMGTTRKIIDGNQVIRSERLAELYFKFEMAVRARDGVQFFKDVCIPASIEVMNVLVIGAMGSGKTVFLTPIVRQFYDRKNRSIILDNKLDYCEIFGEEEGALILSPFDARSPPWNVAEDIVTELEALEFVKVMIPEVDGPNNYFALAAQDVCVGAIKYLQKSKPFAWNLGEVLEVLEKDDLLKILKDYHPGALQILKDCTTDEQTGKMIVGKTSTGIFSQIRANLQNFEILARAWPQTSGGFSIRKWAKGADPKTVFVIVPFMQLYPAISGFFSAIVIDLFVSEILNLPDDHNRRVGIFLDELGAIPRIKSLANATKLLRSKGGCIFVGIQEIGFINKKYAMDGGAETILNGFSTKLIGRSETGEYSDYFVKLLGKNKYQKTTRSRSVDASGKRSISTTEEIVVEDAITSGELQCIPPASLKRGAVFYLKMSEIPKIFRLVWPIVPYPKKFKNQVEPAWMARPVRPNRFSGIQAIVAHNEAPVDGSEVKVSPENQIHEGKRAAQAQKAILTQLETPVIREKQVNLEGEDKKKDLELPELPEMEKQQKKSQQHEPLDLDALSF